MKKLLVATALLILGTAGTAAADRYHGNRGDHRDRVVTRDRGWNNQVVTRDRGWNNRDRRVVVRDRDRHVNRRPVYVNNGRYTFNNGRTFNYRRPLVNVQYTNYQYRPTLLVENYDTVPGYLWVAGTWQWSGYEWTWVNGHYEVDQNFDDNYAPASNYQYAPVSPVSNGYGHNCD